MTESLSALTRQASTYPFLTQITLSLVGWSSGCVLHDQQLSCSDPSASCLVPGKRSRVHTRKLGNWSWSASVFKPDPDASAHLPSSFTPALAVLSTVDVHLKADSRVTMCFTPIVDQPSCPSPPRVFVHNEALGREVPTEQPTPSTPATRNDGFQLSSPSTRAASTLPSSPTLANPDTIIGSSPVAACGRSSSHQNSPEAAGAEEQSPKTITTTVSVVGPDGMKRPHRLLMSQSVGTDQDGHMMLGA